MTNAPHGSLDRGDDVHGGEAEYEHYPAQQIIGDRKLKLWGKPGGDRRGHLDRQSTDRPDSAAQPFFCPPVSCLSFEERERVEKSEITPSL
ncbi:hypothetical protein [Pseudomonas putida]|uniref:hypothetical protein n=1 Tax=Pseudomonas putida TaxID=303 RepID=UPI0012D2F196|nr:hypothetical protein [Pseudomonas putida]